MSTPHAARAERPSPYVGARPFEADDRALFFGRTAESAAVAGLWRRHRVTLLHGPAGVGKTSLLLAGVLPSLRAGGANVLPVARADRHRPVFPTAALPEQNPYTFALLSSWSPHESPIRLCGLSISEFLRRRERQDRFGEPQPTLVGVDGGGRFFRTSPACDRTHRDRQRRFARQLIEALESRPRTHLLVGLRDDDLDPVHALFAPLGADAVARFALPCLDRDTAREAVRGPLVATGHPFDPESVDRLVEEFRTPARSGARRAAGVHPAVLQMTCAGIWSRFRPGAGAPFQWPVPAVDDALTESCARTLTTVAAEHGLPPQRLGSWLRAAMASRPPAPAPPANGAQANGTPPANGAPPVNGVGRGLDADSPILRALEDRYLLRRRVRQGRRCYELQHPRLTVPVRRLGTRQWRARPPEPAKRLRTALLAFAEGDLPRALLHAEGAARRCGPDDPRTRAEAEVLLGNIAHERRLPEAALDHYRAAAGMFEAIQDPAAAGRLLSAAGQVMLSRESDVRAAVGELRAAVARAPRDLTVQTALGVALWYAGQPEAALDVLGEVLHREGDTSEALRSRGEILADLGEVEPALRDLVRIDRRVQPSAQAAWALALAMGGRIDDARQEISGIGPAGDDSGPALFRTARVLELSGDREAATRLTALALDASRPRLPGHQRAAARRLLAELGHRSVP